MQTTVKPVVRGNKLVFNLEESKVITGTDRMIAIGGGVRASVGKTREGKTVVASYIFDRDRFDETQAVKWLDKNAAMIEKAMEKVQEGAAAGSFADITMRLQAALNESDLFPMSNYSPGSAAYLNYVFPNYAIVEYNNEFYKVDYEDSDGQLTLSNPTKCSMEFVAREAGARREKIKASIHGNMSFGIDTNSIKEVDSDGSRQEVVLCLIEAGKNFSKKRYYPKETLKEAAPLFAGLKMYLDHPTPTEEREQPERSLADWVSTIVESWYEDGKIMGRAKVHNQDFWNKLKEDDVFRNNVAVSINASGKRYERDIDGQPMEVIEQILNPKSVDWVTEPGARGRVEYILESQRKEREGDINMLKTVTLEEVQKERPDLIEAVKKLLEADSKKAVDAAVKEAIAAHDKKLQEAAEAAKVKEAQSNKIKQLCGAAKLPKTAIERLIDKLLKETYADDADLEKKVKETIEAELKYIAEVGGKKIGVETGADKAAGGIKETVENEMAQRFGVTDEDINKIKGITEKKEESPAPGTDAKGKIQSDLEKHYA